MSDDYLLKRAREFFNSRVIPWWKGFICKLPEYGPHAIPLLLAGIYLQLRALLEAQQFGATYFRLSPFTITANAAATRILEKESNGRVREVSIWVDAATGGPLPSLRIGTSASTTAGGGIRVLPGQVNELRTVPPNQELWAASTQTITLYIIERA